LLADLPVIVLGFERRTYGLSARVSLFRPNLLGRDLWNAWQIASIGP
jgi:hypothetical protein